ncbi:NepR family anti-sigma factor [Novosphingobium sp.]|uniref:NepR family anti-sigma factor n=1 Tax=Novosphingobium sp. TaxID=1874826 RepID=UPI003B520518
MSDPQQPPPTKRPNDKDGSNADRPEWNKDIKAYYDSIAAEPVPDEIQKLMATLAKAVRK